MNPALRNRAWLLAALALTAGKLWLTRGQGVFAIGGAGHDDRLFLELAQHIARGDWLGPYNELTLAKGPFYPLFIAAAFLVGLPLFLAQHLFYAAACALVVRALRPALPSAGVRFSVFAFLLWNPMSYDAVSMGRVLRQHVYGPLALMIFAGLVALTLRRSAPTRRLWPWAVLIGAAAGAFHLTREESVWFAPTMLLLSGAYLLAGWKAGFGEVRRAAGLLLLALAIAAVPVLTVSALNLRHYGWFGTCEFRASEFKDAYGALLRVRVGPELPYVPITREARVAMAKVSPAFAEVQRKFDGGLARNWAGASESLTQIPREQEQIGGGWMMWALRDAVTQTGHAKSAGEALAFYARIAREINRAGDTGQLAAGPRRSGFLPAWHEDETPRFVRATTDFTDFVSRFSRFSAKPPFSSGSPDELELFRHITGERLSLTEEEASLPGAKDDSLRQWRTDTLHAIGKVLRPVLLALFWIAHLLALARLGWMLWQRRWSYAMTVAAAAWIACACSIAIHAMIEATSFPVYTVSSFAPIYPLLLVFIAAAFWDFSLFWQRSGEVAPASVPIATETKPAPVSFWLPAGLALAALLPFVIWQAKFRELVWFADDFFLLDQLSIMGFSTWTLSPFAENFVPLFKALWGAVVLGLDGSYPAMLAVLWLTHAANAALLCLTLMRAGLSRAIAALVVLCFALTPANIETLGWSVQWSAMLATSFLLLGLLWLMARDEESVSLRCVIGLTLLSAASAASFSRGVLTGGVFALGLLLPALLAADLARLRRSLLPALWCLAPSVLVALIIRSAASGNHQNLQGHWGEVLEFGASFFLLNPGQSLAGGMVMSPFLIGLLALAKVGIIGAGFWLTRGRLRTLLLLCLACDLGNALLLGIGRYHTGFFAALSSRYQYSSLIATLPFVAVIGEALLNFIKPLRWRQATAAILGLGIVAACLSGWPAELKSFCGWRGAELRQLLAAPATKDPAVRVPALEFMHIERAKALQRTYNLH